MFARVTMVEGLANQWDKTKELLKTQAVQGRESSAAAAPATGLATPKRGRSWRLPCTSPRRSFGQAPTRSRP